MTDSLRNSNQIRVPVRLLGALAICIPITVFGGTSDPTGIGGALVVAIILAPLVVLVGLGAALGRATGACIGLALYLAGLGILWFSVHKDDREMYERAAQRNEAISICKTELPDVLPEYLVDSLLLDAGVVEGPKVKRLLGEQGLAFVEIRAAKIKGPRDGVERWGVLIVDGDSSSMYSMPKDFSYLRISLTTNDDPRCEKQGELPFGLTSHGAPFSPDACMLTEHVQQASASHEIQGKQKDQVSKFSRWALIERHTGKTLVALTSSDKPDSPRRQPTSNTQEIKPSKYGAVSCREPYFSIADALRANPNEKFPRLSLQRKVIQPLVPDSPNITSNWHEITAEEILVLDWGKRDSQHRITNPWGPDWVAAFQLAQRTGVASIAGELIDYQAGELLSLRPPKYGGEWLRGYNAASKDGFVFVATYTKIVSDGIPLFRFSLNGELVWKGSIRSEHAPDESLGKFDPISITWEPDAVLIFGFRHNKTENRSQVSMLRVPNSAIGLAK